MEKWVETKRLKPNIPLFQYSSIPICISCVLCVLEGSGREKRAFVSRRACKVRSSKLPASQYFSINFSNLWRSLAERSVNFMPDRKLPSGSALATQTTWELTLMVSKVLSRETKIARLMD